jgi:DNA-binding MarR family transcriptional regulator
MARKPVSTPSPRSKDGRVEAQSLGEQHIGREARAVHDDHQTVKLWLRMLSCSTQIEQEIRSRLRQRFATTLPRFDYLAQLERHPDGLRMNALTRYLMVTGGNVTALTDQLVAEGWVARTPDAADRRSLIVKLTRLGRTRFLAMAAEHEGWLLDMLSGFDAAQRDQLYDTLGKLRLHLVNRVAAGADQPAGLRR